MTIQTKYNKVLFGLLVVVLMGTIGSPAALAQGGDDVDVNVDVAAYYEIILPGDALITMNPVNSSVIDSGNPYLIIGAEDINLICNTPIRLRTLQAISLLLNGVGPQDIPITASVTFTGSAVVGSGTDGGYSYVDLDPGNYAAPADEVSLSVFAMREWTVSTNAGTYSGNVTLEIGPQP